MLEEGAHKGLTRRSFVAGAIGAAALCAAGCAEGGTASSAANGGGGGGAEGGATPASTASQKPETQELSKIFTCRLASITTLDPRDVSALDDVQVSSCLFTPLTTYSYKDGSLTSGAADWWKVNTQNTEFTFYLVQNAAFHDNTIVVADDFKRAWERVANPTAGSGQVSYAAQFLELVQGYDEFVAGDADEISGLEAADDFTFKVTLKTSWADFAAAVSTPALGPVPACIADDEASWMARPVGNGPFKLATGIDGDAAAQGEGDSEGEAGGDVATSASATSAASTASAASSAATSSAASASGDVDASQEEIDLSQGMTLVKFRDYSYGDPALVDAVSFVVEPDTQTAWEMFLRGELDFTEIPPGEMSEATSLYGESADGYTMTPGGQVLLGAEEGMDLLVCNLGDDLGASLDFRYALARSIDETAICQSVYDGTRAPAGGVLPIAMGGSASGAWEAMTYSLEDGATCLANAGYEGGEGLDVIPLYVEDTTLDAALASAIAENLAQIGLVFEAHALSAEELQEALEGREFSFAKQTVRAEYPVREGILRPLLYSTGRQNFSGLADENIDLTLDAARALEDGGSRYTAYAEVEQAAGLLLPVIPLQFFKHHHVGSKRVQSLYYTPACRILFAEVEISD